MKYLGANLTKWVKTTIKEEIKCKMNETKEYVNPRSRWLRS